jgi:hypothetical protein
MVGFVFSVEQ